MTVLELWYSLAIHTKSTYATVTWISLSYPESQHKSKCSWLVGSGLVREENSLSFLDLKEA